MKEYDYKAELTLAREFGGVDEHTRRIRIHSRTYAKRKPKPKVRARNKAARKMRRKQRG